MVRRRRLIYRMKGFGVRKCSGEHREIGGVPERVSGVPEEVLGLMGHKGEHHSPQGAVRPPLGPLLMRLRGLDPLGQPHPLEWGARHLGGGNPRACAALGRRPPTALAAGPPRGNPRAPPSHLFPLYIEGQREGSQHTFVPRCCPPSPITSSSPAVLRRSPAGVLLHHHHHAVVLPVLHQPLLHPLLDQEGGDVPEPYV